jgi:hypothetical protein
MHYIRETIFYKDGNIEPKSYLVKDFKRPVWVTKQNFRNHNDKKEFEDRDKLIQQYTTQSDINKTVAGLLGAPHLTNQPDQIKNSPYVYGYDITSTSLIKYTSLKKNNFIQSLYTVASCDIETNPETNEIILITIAFKNKSYTGILSKFVKNISDLNNRIRKAIDFYLPNYKDLDAKFEVFNNEIDMLTKFFEVANDWAPVFLAIWNINFDIPKILEKLKMHNVNPIDVICDKSIPRKYRICRYKQGITKKITASGVVKPINPSLQWHTLISTSKFYVIDSMCVYRQLRMAKQEETSYALDNILKKEGLGGKLKFKEADAYSGLKWHLFMQTNYPIEYIIYNLYDCLSMLELDNKIKDLSSTLPSFTGITDFSKFNSNPKKIVDALFLFGLERDRIIGTVPKLNKAEEELEAENIDDSDSDFDSDIENDEYDPKKYKTLGLKGWIQLLPQNLLIHDGLKCLEEYPEVITNIRGMVCDQDASAAYPSATLVGNVSKETCINELIKIENIKEEVFKEQNLSICLGNANLLEYFTVMFDMPSLLEVDQYLKKYNILENRTS